MLRRAISSILPRATRALGLCTTVSTVVAHKKQSFAHDIARGSFCSRPLFRSLDDMLFEELFDIDRYDLYSPANFHVLDEMLYEEEQDEDAELNEDPPFFSSSKVTEDGGNIFITRSIGDRSIEVKMDMLNVDKEEPYSIPVVATISKRNHHKIEFRIRVFPFETALNIDSLSIRYTSTTTGELLPHQGPDFGDMDEDLQEEWYEYLNTRVIPSPIFDVMLHYTEEVKSSLSSLRGEEQLKRPIIDLTRCNCMPLY